MGAIKLATNLADRLDRKPARAYYEAESKEDWCKRIYIRIIIVLSIEIS